MIDTKRILRGISLLTLLIGLGLPAARAEETDETKKPVELPPGVEMTEHDPAVFGPDPAYEDKPYDAAAQEVIYGGKHLNRTARPPIEWGHDLYDRGPLPKSYEWFGALNPASPQLLVYGDLRAAAAWNDDGVEVNGETHQATVATRLNLDVDFRITANERIHAFLRPFDKDGSFLRYDFDGKNDAGSEGGLDANLETLFFEGDWGAMLQGFTGRENQLDLPFTLGFVPLFTQNGIWINDAFYGGAIAIPAFNSRTLDVSNADLTFFAGFDKITTPAVPEDAAQFYGIAGFAEANQGYWEYGYAFVDSDIEGLAYHNTTVAFSKRYGANLTNSVRIINNSGQDGAAGIKTADGTLVLIENSWITRKPYTLVPYFNLFAGFDRPQPLARAAGTGGALVNTGITFESDGLTGFPTLDDSGRDSYGGAFGVQYLFNLDRQIVFEVAAVRRMEDRSIATGDQIGFGLRFQEPLTNAWILRLDAIYGLRDDGRSALGQVVPVKDIFGGRVEIRRKF